MLSETFSIVSYSRFQCLGVKILSTLKRVYQIQRKRNHLSKSISALPTCAIDRDAIPTNHPRLLTFRCMLRACSDIWTKKIACRLKKQHRLTQNDHPRPPHRLECWGDMDNDKDEAYEAGGLERSSRRCQGSYLLIGILTMICKDQLANTKNCDWNIQLYLDLPIPKVQFQPSHHHPEWCHVFLDPPQRSRAVGSERWIKYRASLLP